MAEAGIGVDIVEIDRMEAVLEKTPSFARRFFTEEERAYCDAKARPAIHYAARFAAREAVLKALGTGFGSGVGRWDVSVSRDRRGKPIAVLSGRALEIAKELGIREVALSLSHTRDLAVANALAITDDVKPRAKTSSTDERAELARSFKEARSVLDELELVERPETDNPVNHVAPTVMGGSDETDSQLR